jgi:hypothetical protein
MMFSQIQTKLKLKLMSIYTSFLTRAFARMTYFYIDTEIFFLMQMCDKISKENTVYPLTI